MPVRPLVILPDSQLRLISNPLEAVDARVRAFIEDMFATMYDAPGIGLAAIQVGVAQRIVTLDLAHAEEERQPMVLINPEITWSSEESSIYQEGCLSIPEYYQEVERPASIRLRYRDIDFKECEIEADGLLSTCIQHEVDHLNGVLFIDHISRLKRSRVITKFTKLAKLRDEEA